jgi:hypothetical protein
MNQNYLKLSDTLSEVEDSQEKLEALLHMMGQELHYEDPELHKEDILDLALKYPKIISLLSIAIDYSNSVMGKLDDIQKQLVICDQGGNV